MQSQNLYILPFDHRSSFYKNLLGMKRPLSRAERKKVVRYKKIVFKGFFKVFKNFDQPEKLGVLIDEEFSAKLYKVCKKKNITLIQTVEKSGEEIFKFEYGNEFGRHLLDVEPNFAKVLVRYDVENKKANLEQLKRLKKFNDFCRKNKISYIFELLVQPDLKTLSKSKMRKSRIFELRNRLTVRSIREIRNYGIEPDVWKLEPQESRKEWQNIISAIKAEQKIIILGRAGSKKQVANWLKKGKKFKQIIGFAVGRTVFYDALLKYRNRKISQKQAVDKIAKNYQYFINLWEK